MSTPDDDPIQETTRHVGALVRAVAVGTVELGQVRARRDADTAHRKAAQLRADTERARAQLAAAKAGAVADKQASRLGPPTGKLAPPAAAIETGPEGRSAELG